MEICLLGPLEVRNGSSVVALPRRQQRALLAALALRVGEVVSTAVTLLNPAVVVLGGDLIGADEPLIAGVPEVVYQRCTALATRNLRIEPSRLGEAAGLTGCAAMVLDRILAPETIDAAR